MSDVLARIDELQKQRAQVNADIDREIEGLKAKALHELDGLRSRLAQFESILNVQVAPREQRAPARVVRSEIDETDAGNGVGEVDDNVSAASFIDELAMLRERTQAKRRRLA